MSKKSKSEKHPNLENHKKIMQIVNKHFRPLVMSGQYVEASAIAANLYQIMLDASGVKREEQPMLAATTIAALCAEREPQKAAVVKIASADEVQRFGSGRNGEC